MVLSDVLTYNESNEATSKIVETCFNVLLTDDKHN